LGEMAVILDSVKHSYVVWVTRARQIHTVWIQYNILPLKDKGKLF
jgi:hypothetical protein